LLAASESSLLLLDEPTSALDSTTGARVFERLRDGLPDVCIVASVHRLSALDHFDKVILMVDGHVTDAGSVDEEMRRHPHLRAGDESNPPGAVESLAG
jgi:ABC-type bacteriocin/lantibiotic exporter with double-glycine peptidase domain